MCHARFFVLFFVLVLCASASPVEMIVEFTSHGEDRTMYVSADDLSFGLTSNCSGGFCGFYFTTPQPNMPVSIEFANDFDPHHSYYWQDPNLPYEWHHITSGPYLDNPVSFNPSQAFSLVTSSSNGFYDTAVDAGYYRLSRIEYPDLEGAPPPDFAAATPEPSAYVLFCSGLAALALWRRRRQKMRH